MFSQMFFKDISREILFKKSREFRDFRLPATGRVAGPASSLLSSILWDPARGRSAAVNFRGSEDLRGSGNPRDSAFLPWAFRPPLLPPYGPVDGIAENPDGRPALPGIFAGRCGKHAGAKFSPDQGRTGDATKKAIVKTDRSGCADKPQSRPRRPKTRINRPGFRPEGFVKVCYFGRQFSAAAKTLILKR